MISKKMYCKETFKTNVTGSRTPTKYGQTDFSSDVARPLTLDSVDTERNEIYKFLKPIIRL